MNDYFNETLKEILYSFSKILSAVETKNLNAIEFIAKQEIKAIEHDLEILEGDKK